MHRHNAKQQTFIHYNSKRQKRDGLIHSSDSSLQSWGLGGINQLQALCWDTFQSKLP